jgi:hypothetical protein
VSGYKTVVQYFPTVLLCFICHSFYEHSVPINTSTPLSIQNWRTHDSSEKLNPFSLYQVLVLFAVL